MMTRIPIEANPYIENFDILEKTEFAKDPPWFRSLRKAAISHFAEKGFPTTREEEWRFTSVSSIATASFKPVPANRKDLFASGKIEPFLFGLKECARLVFVNGLYCEMLSQMPPRLPSRVRVENLARVLEESPDLVEGHLARYAPYGNNGFSALNTAFIRDGAYVFLPRGAEIEGFVHLLFVGDRNEALANVRNLIVAERGSRVAIVESFVSLEDSAHFTNTVTEIQVAGDASVDHYKIQNESSRAFHIGTTEVNVGKDSRFSSFSLSAGSRLARNNLNVCLDAPGGECALYGLYLLSGSQHIDNHTMITHAKPYCNSREFYKGIVDEKSRAVFNGRVVVVKDAQKTDARQTNKNLLLSDAAHVNAKPQLEIFADDVKCTHGATVGQLDEEALFYFKSRGIGEGAARALITYGFAKEVVARVPVEPIRLHLDRLVLRKLKQEGKGGEEM
ncbi:MAG: Fe-S cluster assembly protein SufD [Armatimonadetes bacterium]|nr:Fe-S cluster assembly protein SufD [Armatimonadota bacterium]